MESKSVAQAAHRLVLDEQRRLEVTGVREVLRFDEAQVVLQTVKGLLIAQGEGLRLKTLTPENGRVAVEGTVRALQYARGPVRGGFWKRLFG